MLDYVRFSFCVPRAHERRKTLANTACCIQLKWRMVSYFVFIYIPHRQWGELYLHLPPVLDVVDSLDSSVKGVYARYTRLAST
jgi:hypothetical protein